MKKKSPRGIPDFSSKKGLPKQRQLDRPVDHVTEGENRPKPHFAAPKPKPPATSVKFGRRGA